MKGLKKILISMCLCLGLVPVSVPSIPAQARVLTDDEGDQIDVPDDYFLDDKVIRETKLWIKYALPSFQNWVKNPDTKMSDISSIVSKFYPDLTTFNKFIDAYADSYKNGTNAFYKENLKRYYTSLAFSPDVVNEMADSLDDGNIHFFTSSIYGSIVKPKDITVYNATKNNRVNDALKISINEWKKDQRFHFRIVDNPQEARIILTDTNLNPEFEKNFEKNINGTFVPTQVYNEVLLKGYIVLSPDIEKDSTSDTKLTHDVMHEVGHVIGRRDIV